MRLFYFFFIGISYRLFYDVSMQDTPIELIDRGIRAIAYEEHDNRMERFVNIINQAFIRIEKRLDAIEARLYAIEARLGSIEKRLDKVEQRLDVLEKDMAKVKKHLRIS